MKKKLLVLMVFWTLAISGMAASYRHHEARPQNTVTNLLATSSVRMDMPMLVSITNSSWCTLTITKEYSVHFSPNGGCADAVVAEIGKATNHVWMLAYYLTSPKITDAIVACRNRGVPVSIVLDEHASHSKFCPVKRLKAAKCEVRLDAKHAIMHNKVVVIDGETLLTGSYNWTDSAERSNGENLLTVINRQLCAQYIQNWSNHWSHSE